MTSGSVFQATAALCVNDVRPRLSSYLPWGVKWCEVYEIIHFWTAVVDELNTLTTLPMCGFIAQLVEQGAGNAEVTGSNPVEGLISFFQASSFQLLKLENLLRWSFFTLIYCTVTLLPCYLVTLLCCYPVTLLCCYPVTLLRCYFVILLLCYLITLLPCYSVSLFPWDRANILQLNDVAILENHFHL